MRRNPWLDFRDLALATVALAVLTLVLRGWWGHTNPTTTALVFLLVVLGSATRARLWVASAVSILAFLGLNYFFMPPYGTFAIADAENIIALAVFLAVSLIASSLSTAARDRALARQSAELTSTLLASLGHNLRTPLTAIRVASDNLQHEGLAETDRREQTDVIRTEVNRLQRLFDQVHDLAQVDAGTVTAHAEWVSLLAIYDAALDRIAGSVGGRDVRVTRNSDELVYVDPRLTAGALAHVLENAAQYSPSHTPIDVTLSLDTDGLMCVVRDYGSGIAPDDLAHVFDAFYRGRSAERRPAGTGMGLSIARGLLAAERGRISAARLPEGGSAFTIRVPGPRRPPAEVDE